jgi:hypothetical protein
MSLELISKKVASQIMGSEVPGNWISLTTEEQLAWLADNASSDFEAVMPDDLLRTLDDNAELITGAIVNVLTRVKAGLIHGAIESEIPDDYMMLDLQAIGGLYAPS